MPYYEYYSFSYFFFLILLFFLLILILFPSYTKKDIVPPLSNANYEIVNAEIGTLKPTDIKTSTFSDLTIEDGEDSGTAALDFGGGVITTATVSYIPYHQESHQRLAGFFQLSIGTSLNRTLAFRAVDSNVVKPADTLENYNYGWSSLSTVGVSHGSTPIYNVNVPFNLPGKNDTNHDIRVQISALDGGKEGLELSSAYLYYSSF